MFEARKDRRAAAAANRLTTAQLEAILKAKRANEPGVLDVSIKAIDDAQVAVRATISEGLGWLASAIRP